MITNNKNIVFFDLETTGLDSKKDRIIQVGMIKTDLDGNIISAVEQLLYPDGVKSSPDAFAKHHIDDASLLGCPLFGDIADGITSFVEGCDLAGHNIIRFDIPFLMMEFKRCGKTFSIEKRSLYDTKVMYQHYNQMHLKDIHKAYCPDSVLDCEAHDAICDTKMTLEVFFAMKKKHSISQTELDIVNRNDTRIDMDGFFLYNENNEIVVGKGKYKGKRIEDVDPSYFQWLAQGDVLPETQALAARCYNYIMKKK